MKAITIAHCCIGPANLLHPQKLRGTFAMKTFRRIIETKWDGYQEKQVQLGVVYCTNLMSSRSSICKNFNAVAMGKACMVFGYPKMYSKDEQMNKDR